MYTITLREDDQTKYTLDCSDTRINRIYRIFDYRWNFSPNIIRWSSRFGLGYVFANPEWIIQYAVFYGLGYWQGKSLKLARGFVISKTILAMSLAVLVATMVWEMYFYTNGLDRDSPTIRIFRDRVYNAASPILAFGFIIGLYMIASRFKAPRLVADLSLATFGVYIVHFPILVCTSILVDNLGLPTPMALIMTISLVTVASFTISRLVYVNSLTEACRSMRDRGYK